MRVSSVAVIAHRYTFAPPRCRTSQYRRTFIPLSVSLWKDLGDPILDGVGLAGFRSRAMPFYWPSCSLPFRSPTVFHFSSFILSQLKIIGVVQPLSSA